MEFRFLDLGMKGYKDVWEYQLSLVGQRAVNMIPDTVLLLEHEDVITLGRRGKTAQILKVEIPSYSIERGGEATYHGPGQLVCYPIVHISQNGIGVLSFVRMLEDVIIKSASSFGITSSRLEGKPGVWVGSKKLASIGIAIRHWVTFHGFALNVNTDLAKFASVRPCGMESSVMTSMEEIIGQKVPIDLVKERVREKFEMVFSAVGPEPIAR